MDSKAKYRHLGIAKISLKALEDVLGLSSEHKIVDIEFDMNDRVAHTMQLLIEGPKLPKHEEGMPVQYINLYMGSNGKVRFDDGTK